MEWDDVRFFLALARAGSVRGAGASLSVSHSTVARRIEALESGLGTRLFDRDRDGYRLTAAGRQTLADAETVERAMATFERGLAGQDDRLQGDVRLTCCDSFVADIVLGGLEQFCEQHTGIELSFTTDSRSFDLSKREADIAIRLLPIGGSPPGHLIGQKLVPVFYGNYVSRALSSRLLPGATDGCPRWLAFRDRKQTQAMAAGSSYAQLPLWGSFSSIELMAQAARRGFGLTMLPCYVGDLEPTLERAPEADLRHVADLWLVSHPDLRDNARLREARMRVSETLRGLDALFRGEQADGK